MWVAFIELGLLLLLGSLIAWVVFRADTKSDKSKKEEKEDSYHSD